VYSSSIYAPAGTLLRRGRVWEIPVSTLRWAGGARTFVAPRQFTWGLLLGGEFPYGSSFSLGLLQRAVFSILSHELKRGFSPVLFVHPYEIVRPPRWLARVGSDVLRHPLLWPFTWNKAALLTELLREFPVSSLGSYLDEAMKLPAGS
jgi:hypothetical protein